MPPLAYTVTATLPDHAAVAEYVRWLGDGHLAAVRAGGAESAEVIAPRSAADPAMVESRYIFPTEAAFRAYEAGHAPALRAQGLARFGPDRGVVYTRRIGLLVLSEREKGGEGGEGGGEKQ